MRPRPSLAFKRQRGAALLTAMIIVTLVATLAAAMVWQQWRAVQVEAAERGRTQAAWVLSGALDFARLILSEDQKSNRPTALTEPWATPLAESRLSTFLSADSDNTDDGPEAFLSGTITDAQGRYNVMNLVNTDPATAKAELDTMTRLCSILGLDVGIAQRIATGLQAASATTPIAGAPLLPTNVSQLTWLGVDAASVEALRPYVSVLNVATSLSVNTASKEVLAAVLNIDPATAQRLVAIAQKTPFQTAGALLAQLPPGTVPPTAKLDVKSSYFEVRGRLRLADRVLVERTLLQRNGIQTISVLDQERLSSLEQEGS